MKRQSSVIRTSILVFAALFLSVFFLSPADAKGPDRISIDPTSSRTLKLVVGKSIIVESPEAVKRVSLTDPKISDAIVLTAHQIYLTGKDAGVTNLTLWGSNDKVLSIFDLEVSPDLSRLKESLHEVLPDEKGIRVTTSHDNITLSGSVSSTASLSQVLSLAGAYAPKDKDKNPKIINMLEIAGINQVMLEVRVSEMSKSLIKRLGFNFNYIGNSGRTFGVSTLNNLTSLSSGVAGIPAQSPSGTSTLLPDAGFPASALTMSNQVGLILRFLGKGATWTNFIDALKEDGLIKVLAEPTLITLSGKTANFLAGGEFPIPVPQSSSGGGTVITVEYKPFGVALKFSPVVLSSGKINMQVTPEVSDLDFSNAIVLQGFVIPSITTRRVSTDIELADGQTFAIAGLLRSDVRQLVTKFPVLGDLPILGALFRSTSFQKNESELVITVTPHLVKPIDMTKQTLPTDQYVEPDDLEFFLLGKLESGREPALSKTGLQPNAKKQDGLEGDFGHIVPE
jgi:pilus assembly protein CpaC